MANIAWVLRESDSAFGLCASEPPAALGEAALSPFIGGDCGIVHLGRRNELMNAGGLRVSPLEIEQELAKRAALGEVAAAEVSIHDGVSIIAAFVAARAGVSVENLAGSLRGQLKDFLPHDPDRG